MHYNTKSNLIKTLKSSPRLGKSYQLRARGLRNLSTTIPSASTLSTRPTPSPTTFSLSAPQRKLPNPSRAMSSSTSTKKDWSATQYLKFHSQRTRPVHDLVAQIKPLINNPNPVIYDLGCGPGNSTRVLLDAFPGAQVVGVDSSADMLRQARQDFGITGVEGEGEAGWKDVGQGGKVRFEMGDVGNYAVTKENGQAPDLIFSNAVFHWLRSDKRIPSLAKLFKQLKPGGVLAIQVPDNYNAPTHALMRETALLPDKPWSHTFSSSRVGDISCATRPDLDPIEHPASFFNALRPHAQNVDIWRTEYQHVLPDAQGIVEWVKGTGLQPYLNAMGDEEKRGFLEEYRRALEGSYGGELVGEEVVLGYMRLFLVGVRQ